jgi:hypothetical protein
VEIFAAQGAPSTPVANGKKSSIRKVLIVLFGHLWIVELKHSAIVTIICPTTPVAGVVDASGNLPPVLLTPVTGINDTSSTGGKIYRQCC